MSDRIELNDDSLKDVVGGALVWKKDYVYPKDNPDAVYHYSDLSACVEYIKKNWKGGAQTEQTLLMLKAAGLVW